MFADIIKATLVGGLMALTGCQSLQTTKQPMPFVLSTPNSPSTIPTIKKDPSDDEPFFLLERWF